MCGCFPGLCSGFRRPARTSERRQKSSGRAGHQCCGTTLVSSRFLGVVFCHLLCFPISITVWTSCRVRSCLFLERILVPLPASSVFFQTRSKHSDGLVPADGDGGDGDDDALVHRVSRLAPRSWLCCARGPRPRAWRVPCACRRKAAAAATASQCKSDADHAARTGSAFDWLDRETARFVDPCATTAPRPRRTWPALRACHLMTGARGYSACARILNSQVGS